MIRMIHRRLALLFALLLLLSALCPVSAWAEPDGENLSDLTDPLEQENEIEEDEPEELVEEQEDSGNLDLTDKKPASDQNDQLQKKETDLSEDGKEKSADSGIEAKDEKASKETAVSSDGKVSAADGSEKTSRSKTNPELFISADGSDESGNGSYEAPFASLEAALAAADALGVDAELSLLSDLSISGTVQISGRNVYLTGNDRVFTITRDEGFNATEGDNALFAVGSPDAENNSGGQLILEHVILDEKGMKTNPVQDAMIEVYSGGRLILGEEAILFNYGGECAIHAREGSEVSLCPTAWILDTMAFEKDDTVAICEDEGSSVIRQAGCLVLSHGEVWEAEGNGSGLNGQKNENADDPAKDDTQDESKDASAEGMLMKGAIQKRGLMAGSAAKAAPALTEGNSTLGLSLDAPETIAKDDKHDSSISSFTGSVAGYLVPYTISFSFGDILRPSGTIGNIAANAVESIEAHLSITIDERLFPETAVVDSMQTVFFTPSEGLNVKSAVYNESSHTIDVTVNAQEAAAWSEAKTLKLELKTILPESRYPEPIDENRILSASAEAKSVTIAYTGGTWSPTLSGVSDEAETALIGDSYATLIYYPNEGSGGPGTKKLEPQEEYELERINVPTHESSSINGKETRIVFCGWKKTEDDRIYSRDDKESLKGRIAKVDLTAGETSEVYAVYGFDENDDGIADVDQRFLTLQYDANGGVGAPEAQTKVLLGNRETFNIAEKEPSKKYSIFQGWSEDPDATEYQYKYNEDKKDKITISEDTCLYAVWKPSPVYTLYFNGNGGTNVPAAQSAPSDNGVAELTITNQIPTRTGRKFVGWSTQRYGSAAFDPGEDVRITGGDVTLFAVWQRTSSWSGHSPKTGDESNIPLYAALAVGSAATAFFIIRFLRKRGK